MKKIILLFVTLAYTSALFAQIKFKIEVLPDDETYLVSFVSDTTYSFPGYIMASGQVTIRVPHGIGPNRFEVANLTMETTGGTWLNNSRQDAPPESPSWDYISFGLTSFGTNVYAFTDGVPIPVFSFKNSADACADSVEIIVNEQDPFYPPNSMGANIGNSIVLLGGGLNNVYSGTIGTGVVPCKPETQCTDETISDVYLCPGQTYQGQIFTQDTIFEEHYTSFAGCDSVFVTHIYSWVDNFPPVDTIVCEGDLFNGVPITQDETIEVLLSSFGGCDSTVTYHVTMATTTSLSENITVVPGQSVYGIPVYSDTTIVQNLVSSSGCDSTVTTQVAVFNVPVTTLDAEICQGDTYNGNFYAADTTLIDTLMGASGFDSIVLTNLFIYPSYHVINHVYLCEGESFNGSVYMIDDSFTDFLQTVHGCDSTIVTNIHVLNPQTMSVDTVICQGDLYQGTVFTKDTVFSSSVLSVNGCDSVVMETVLRVLPTPDAQIAGDTELCAGETGALTAFGGTGYTWNSGETTNSITINGPSNASVTVTNSFGCENVASVTVRESDLKVDVDVISPVCSDDPAGEIIFDTISGGFEPYVFSIDGGNVFTSRNGFQGLPPGMYDLEAKDAVGCNWETSVEITEPIELYLNLGSDESIRLGESVSLQPQTNLPNPTVITWTPDIGLDCSDCMQTTATPFESITYQLSLVDSSGCTIEDEVRIVVNAERKIFVPNAFSPNGDGINDLLTVFSGDEVAIIRRFAIFERWGGEVFLAEDFSPNAVVLGWDGSWRGESMPVGMYIWMAEVEFVDGKVELFEGGVHLIR